jgi:hypothetical protein
VVEMGGREMEDGTGLESARGGAVFRGARGEVWGKGWGDGGGRRRGVCVEGKEVGGRVVGVVGVVGSGIVRGVEDE